MNFSESLNSTSQTATFDGPVWTSVPCLTLGVLISALVATCSTLYLFYKDRSLITPFTVYVLNLLISNLLLCLLFYPFFLINQLYSIWPIGNWFCTLYQYGAWVIAGGLCNTHALIALNRLWAVTFPMSYRRRHKTKLALYVCLGMWLILHICSLPGIAMDHLYYRLPVETNRCNFVTDAPASWLWTVQLLLFDFPILIVLTVYPVVCWKAVRRVRQTVEPVREGLSGTATRQVSSFPPRSGFAAGQASDQTRKVTRKTGNKCFRFEQRGVGRSVPALSAMTLMVLIVYFPDQLAYTLQMMFDVNIDAILPIVSKLFLMSTILDPISFVLTLKNVRRTFRRAYFCGF